MLNIQIQKKNIIKEYRYNAIFIYKYKIPSTKSYVLRKFIEVVVINLLIISVIFINLSFKSENLIIYILSMY
jgi:hypothetical protein